jgi:Rho termination factor, N-terminal domain
MAKTKLKATKTFYNNGRFTVAGDEFTVDSYQANAYLTRELAEKVEGQEVSPEPEHAPTEPAMETKAPPIGAVSEPAVYENMTVAELRKIAKEKGVTGYSTMNKQDLIMVIVAIDNQPGGDQA